MSIRGNLYYRIIVGGLFLSLVIPGRAGAADIPEGKKVFSGRCASCHSVTKDLTGPALKNVDQRHTEEWIIRFVHGSQSVIKSGDAAAVQLFEKFNKTIMPDHPDLSTADIQNILAYIKDESAKLANPPVNHNVPGNPKPYTGKSSVLHQIVYLDIAGEHRPLDISNPLIIIALGGAIIILVLTLVMVVRVNDFAEKQKNRYS